MIIQVIRNLPIYGNSLVRGFVLYIQYINPEISKRKPTLMDFYRHTTFIDWTCANIVKYYRDKLERKDWKYVLDKVKKNLRDITASDSGFSRKALTAGR